jgi:hypothetical protein
MRVKEFLLKQNIFEVSMKPSILKQEAAKTSAIAGMEFEMIIPDFELKDPEPDMEKDEEVRSLKHIYDFFIANGVNSDRSARTLVNSIEDSYNDWLIDKWKDEGKEFFIDYAMEYYDEDEAIKRIEDEYDLGDKSERERNRLIEKYLERDREQFIDSLWDEEGSIYRGAEKQWNRFHRPDFNDFTSDVGYLYMSSLPWSDYVEWPSTTTKGIDDLVDLANTFGKTIGKPVKYSAEYHGEIRDKTSYVVEPDGSLEPADKKDYGLEFVSPPMPIDDMLGDLNKVIEWAKSIGAYTNSSTGLHMNVSLPGFDYEKVDYTKLALLLGDQYVLAEFQREANVYAKSSLAKIVNKIKNLSDQDIQDYLDAMRHGMAQQASKLISEQFIGLKYVSINLKEKYVEFRSPGGDWLNSDFSKLENILLRFVVALDASMNPNKHRQEYLKKLYLLLKPENEKDPIAMFAKFNAGELSKLELKQWVSELRGKSTKYWFKVEPTSNMMKKFPSIGSIELVASTQEEAKQKARQEWGLFLANAPNNELKATPIRPYNSNT